MDAVFVTQLLAAALFQLPVLVMYAVGLGLLATRRPGRPRTLALWGLGLLVLVVVLATGLSLLPAWLMSRAADATESNLWIVVSQAIVALLSAVGALLLVLALWFALPARGAPSH
ncbi:hypothetical protein ACP93_14060 [Xanthomonas sp. NCPPB 1128]|uniref:hypothetical protein n=1 Tax=Xanthomonas sp. NCPPB 1128 TaxID=1775876 RepID=UPI00065ACED8|nr:hypothetical protein [Xanthomonas sp. NCPPB 1128]KMM74925.1 hypothetical protein ACP93_14060 [Xanthomonas sp. NCPPB 1128]